VFPVESKVKNVVFEQDDAVHKGLLRFHIMEEFESEAGQMKPESTDGRWE